MQTLFFGLAALITPHNINWVMAVQFLAMLPLGGFPSIVIRLRLCMFPRETLALLSA
jgi:hypothetical protein